MIVLTMVDADTAKSKTITMTREEADFVFAAAEVGAEGAADAGAPYDPETMDDGYKSIIAFTRFLREL